MPPKTQYILPFSWTDRRDIIRDVQLDKMDGVSASMQKAVLRELDSYENNGRGCFASAETIAKNIGRSTAQVKNCFRVLQKQDLIVVVPRDRRGSRGARAKERPINWTELAERARYSRLHYQRLMVPRSTANGHTYQRLMADRSTANEPSDQRLTISHEVRIEEQEKTNTTELVCVVSSFGVGLAEQAVMAALASGLDESEIRMRCGTFESLPPSERLPGTLYNWLTKPGSFQTPKPARKKTGPTIDIEAAKKEREANRAAARSQPSIKEMYRNGNLKTQEATA